MGGPKSLTTLKTDTFVSHYFENIIGLGEPVYMAGSLRNLINKKESMCGIYGVFADQQQSKTATERVFAGIKRIEYRGYDSWGVAVLHGKKLAIAKHVGQIGQAKKLELPESFRALGHTRWATHGGVTQANAHPHLSTRSTFAVVHNGVIENYQALRAELIESGYTFQSETDTETVVGLLDQRLAESDRDQITLEDFKTVMARLDGRSTVAVLTTTGAVFAYRHGSPLVLGRDDQGVLYLSSDVASLSTDASEYMLLEHGQLVTIAPDGVVQIGSLDDDEKTEPTWSDIDVGAMEMDKGGYEHFMLKEIYEQGSVLERVFDDADSMQAAAKLLKKAKRVYAVGAGSASYVGMYLAYLLRLSGVDAQGLRAYEARSFRHLWQAGDVGVFISQSGETADTNEVAEWMQEAGLPIVSIVNMPGSTLHQMSEEGCMLGVGAEVGVASTKAMTGQMTWSYAVSQLVQGVPLKDLCGQTEAYQQSLTTWFDNPAVKSALQNAVSYLDPRQHLFVLGRGELYPSALEFSLKMKELSYIHAEGFSGGELKHGVIALIEDGTPVISLIQPDQEAADMVSASAEVKARGAYLIGVSREPNAIFDLHIPLPDTEDFTPLSANIVSHLLTYQLSVSRGLDPDKPRNLAKSVTVK